MLVLVEDERLCALIAEAVAQGLKARQVDPALLDAQGAADLLALTKQSVEMLSKRGQIPSVVMPNRRRRYERDVLLEWARGE